MPLILAWACFGLVLAIVRPHASIGLALAIACILAGSVLYVAGPSGPWWHGGAGGPE